MDRDIIRGYGGLFRRDWRIYSIPDGKGQRQPLPIRGGLPMRSVGFFFAVLALVWLLTRLPVLSAIGAFLSWPVTFLVLPGAAAFALTQLEPDGRPAIRFLGTMLAHAITPASRSAGRPVRREGRVAILDHQVAVAVSPSEAIGPAVVRGPAELEFRDPVAVHAGRRGRHRARGDAASDTRYIELDAGERLELR